MDWRGDVWQRFRKDLPGLVLIWIAVIAIAIIVQTIDGRGTSNPVEIVLAMSVLGVAMTPIIWIRHEIPLIRGRHHATRHALAVVGLGCLWAIVALVGGFVLLTLLGTGIE